MFQIKTDGYAYYGFAIATYLVSVIVYLMTVQQTLSLWDCGEYIACSYTLGVAHPPGNPLFLLIGRIFSLIPLVSDISHRINLLSVLSSAGAATLGYFVLYKLISFFPGHAESPARRWLGYFCAFSGALLFAFSRTNWSNSVEAEVYALAMVFYFALIWLSLRWYETREQNTAPRYFMIISYLGVLSVAVHMTSFLVIPAIFGFAILADEKLRKDPRFWLSGVALFSITVGVGLFFTIVGIWFAVSLFFYLTQRRREWLLALLIASAAIVGYTPHAYVPIRAAEKPTINQNNPDNWERFASYIERKQYGQQSMFSKMFHRRATWVHQLGDFPRIGFGGFLLDQYGMGGAWFLIPALLVVLGLYRLIRYRLIIGVYFLGVLFLGTIALVLYMNFSDGSLMDPLTGLDKLEVRDRDYFFTPGFITFALCIGLGLYALFQWLFELGKQSLSKGTAIGLGLLTLVFPAIALSANFAGNDRSDNYLPYDYAYNYLMSCPQDAILFTNGDNDTFPLWCLQEVYKVRNDVKIANLSLIQTDWYQLQLKHELGVPISFSDAQLQWDSPTNPRPLEPYTDRFMGGRRHQLMAFQDQSTGRLVSVADQMVENIIEANNWEYPLLFANGVPPGIRYDLTGHKVYRGMLVELSQQRTDQKYYKDVTYDLYMNVYQARNLDNPESYRERVATTLIVAGVQMGIEFADHLAREGDTTRALALTNKLIEQYPEFWQSYTRKANFEGYSPAQADSLVTDYLTYLDKLLENNDDNIFYYQYKALSLQYLQRPGEAIEMAERAFELNPVVPVTYHTLLTLYLQNGLRQKAIDISRSYLECNPGDQTALAMLSGQF